MPILHIDWMQLLTFWCSFVAMVWLQLCTTPTKRLSNGPRSKKMMYFAKGLGTLQVGRQ